MKSIVYIVEDDEDISTLMKFNLENAGYEVICFNDGASMFSVLAKKPPSLFILDIMLPGMDGLEICKKIKNSDDYRKIPVIIASAKSEEFDRVLGLELGADDYISKPFSIRELTARVKAVLRRFTEPENNDDVLISDDIRVERKSRRVLKGSQEIPFSHKEFELICYLLLNKGRAITRDELLDRVWGYDFVGGTRTVDVHIKSIRQKIGDDPDVPKYIFTLRNVGYKFCE